jgi:C-terminal processing protease CtpA/Prc
MRAAPIDSVKQMILGTAGSSLRLTVLRNTPQGQSQITIVLKRSKPVATTNALPPPPPPMQQPQPQAQSTSVREQLSQSRSSFQLAPSRSDNEPNSLYGTRMSVSGDAAQCGVGLSLAPRSDGSIIVKAIAAGSSAQLSGRIQVGDILLAVENQPCTGMDIVDLRPMIVGAHETQVNMTFRDPSNRQPAFTLTLKRFTSRPVSRSALPPNFPVYSLCAYQANCHLQAPPPPASPLCPHLRPDPCSPCHAQASYAFAAPQTAPSM